MQPSCHPPQPSVVPFFVPPAKIPSFNASRCCSGKHVCLLRSCLSRTVNKWVPSITCLLPSSILLLSLLTFPLLAIKISLLIPAKAHIHYINSSFIFLQFLGFASMGLSQLIRIPVTRHAQNTANGTRSLVSLMHKYDITPTMGGRYQRDHNRALVVRRDDDTLVPVYVLLPEQSNPVN